MWQSSHFPRQIFQRFGGNAVLVGILRDVDFDAHLQGRQVFWALVVQAVREFYVVQRVQPVRAFGNITTFVRLNLPDDVPANIGTIGQLFGFLPPFLDVVFAEIALPQAVKFADVLSGKSFADGNQVQAARFAAGIQSSLHNALADFCIGRQKAHGVLHQNRQCVYCTANTPPPCGNCTGAACLVLSICKKGRFYAIGGTPC